MVITDVIKIMTIKITKDNINNKLFILKLIKKFKNFLYSDR